MLTRGYEIASNCILRDFPFSTVFGEHKHRVEVQCFLTVGTCIFWPLFYNQEMDLFRKQAIFFGEDDQIFHEEQLFAGTPLGETLILVGAVKWKDGDQLIDGVIHVSDSVLRLYSIERVQTDGKVISYYNYSSEFPIVGSKVSLTSSSQMRLLSPPSGINWVFDVPAGASMLYLLISAIFKDSPHSLITIWFYQFPDFDYYDLLASQDVRRWSTLRKQIYLILTQHARRPIPYMPFESEFAFDVRNSDIDIVGTEFVESLKSFPRVSCLSKPKLELQYPLLRDRNGYIVPCENWALDLRENPFRGMISPTVLDQNRLVIQNGEGVIQVHCPRCDYFNQVHVNTKNQRKIIAEVNKRNLKLRKAQELQKKADKYRARGARLSGQLNSAREIEAFSAINSALEGVPELLSESDITSDFSIKCFNCGNVADEY